MSAKQCVNCPGRTDHGTAECPVMHYGALDPQQRLEVARGEQPQASAAQYAPAGEREALWQMIRDTLRNYHMRTMDDGYGGGYPLIDAMTADGQPVSGGIEECTYLADAIWDELEAAWQCAQSASGGQISAVKVAPFTWAVILDGKKATEGSERHCRDWADAWNASPSSVENVGAATVAPLFLAAPAQPAAHDQGEVQRLREALDQLANGSHLDAVGNHDDDSLREIAGCCTCGQRNRLLKHAGRVDSALAASTGQEVGK